MVCARKEYKMLALQGGVLASDKPCIGQSGMVASPASGRAKIKTVFICHRSRLRIWSSRDGFGFGRPVSRQPVHSPHSS